MGDAQVQLNIQSGVQLSWPTTTNNTYHLQWSSNPVTTWTDLVAAAVGDGTTNTLYDPFPSGTRSYQVLEIIPGTPPSSAIPVNGGFETGSGSSAANWVVDTAAGGPVSGVRANDNPHSGSFNFEVHLASTGAGPVVQFSQAGVPVTGGTTYPFTFYASALAGSTGYNAEWRILWNAGGDTGYHGFTPETTTPMPRSATPLPLLPPRRRRPSFSTLRARRLRTSRPRLTLMTSHSGAAVPAPAALL